MAVAKLYEHNNYQGQQILADGDIPDFRTKGFNDKLSSVIVTSGTFTLYEHINYLGFSVTICSKGGPGNNGYYPSADFLGGRNDTYSSIRKNSD
ncbi:MAG: beta/gamma crystallin family protein [Acidobacteria bacterium]|jgi:hypothetical protein|nr:beta/gamma crystallin family protein [Acidobacteriota bacterium]